MLSHISRPLLRDFPDGERTLSAYGGLPAALQRSRLFWSAGERGAQPILPLAGTALGQCRGYAPRLRGARRTQAEAGTSTCSGSAPPRWAALVPCALASQ